MSSRGGSYRGSSGSSGSSGSIPHQQQRRPMTMNRSNQTKKKKSGTSTSHTSATGTSTTSNASAATGSTGGMIKIRPYSKPPQLPPNYYESTAHSMLSGCLLLLNERLKLHHSNNNNNSNSNSNKQQQQYPFSMVTNTTSATTTSATTSTTTSSSSMVSLQSAYNTTVDLVRHQFGMTLYSDVVANMMDAVLLILPVDTVDNDVGVGGGLGMNEVTTNSSRHLYGTVDGSDNNYGNGDDTRLLSYISQQYTIYMDYILLLKHICLPLDRTHVWHFTNRNENIPNRSGSNNENNRNNKISDDVPFIHSCAGRATTTGTTSTTSTTNFTAVSTTTTSSTPTSTLSQPPLHYSSSQQSNSSNSNNNNNNNMWSVGSTIFLRRLHYLQYDMPIYQQWISLFLKDWNPTSIIVTTSSSVTETTIEKNSNTEKEVRLLLHQIWYMWQDLHVLSSLSIQTDLQNYWTKQSMEWQGTASTLVATTGTGTATGTTGTSTNTTNVTNQTAASSLSNYSIPDFVLFCHLRMYHIHAHYRNIIQPNIGWMYHIFDTCFIQHHMNLQYIFNDTYFFPLLQDHLFKNSHQNTASGLANQYGTSKTTTTTPKVIVQFNTIQQLWILAGRIPNGQIMMSQAIQRYAKQEGYLRIRYNTPTSVAFATTNATVTNSNNNPPTTTDLPTPTSSTSTVAIEDLLELQNALNGLVQQLPRGLAATSMINTKETNNTTTNSNNNNTTTTTTTTTTANPIVISFKSVWEEVVNVDVDPMSIAEQLAKFLDATLRSNKKIDSLTTTTTTSIRAGTTNAVSSSYGSSSTASISQQLAVTSPTAAQSSSLMLTSEYSWLQRIINGIFIPLQSKDTFEAFFRRDLAKRLLWNRIVSMDAEKYICSLLKAECGTAYTSKIEGMFQDVDWSRETMLVYKQSLWASNTSTTATTTSSNETTGAASGNDVEMEVQVLTTGYWPVYPVYPNLIIPDLLKVQQEQFAQHYHSKYQGRRMIWQYALGHCVIRVNGYNKPYELLVSLCQAVVLIQFTSDTVCLSLPLLIQATGLDDRSEMERILQSLALGKDGTRILRKLEHTAEPGKKTKILMTVDDRDTFTINTKFESKSRRIRITNIMMKETREEREKTIETVSRDRLYLIDAVLVRIMKSRKTILHQALIPQVLEQVKVPAQASDIKKRIESLIEREYMERDSSDHNRYNYLA